MAEVNIKVTTDCSHWLAALRTGADLHIVPNTNGDSDLVIDLPPGAYEVTFAAYQIPENATVSLKVWVDENDPRTKSIYARKRKFAGRMEFIIDENGDLA